MLTKSFSFDLKSIQKSDSGDLFTFEGYAAAFGNVDRGGDVVVKGAFTETLDSFLEEGLILWQHNQAAPIGRPLEAYEDDKGLWIKAEGILTIERGREAYELLKARIVKKNSIGYDVDDYEYLNAKNIEEFAPGATPSDVARALDWYGLALKKVTLFEVSPVSIPANPLADISNVKNVEGLRFDEHLKSVLAALTGLKSRTANINELRKSQGRDTSAAGRKALTEIADLMGLTLGDIKELLIAPQATPTADEKNLPDAATLRARATARQQSQKAAGITFGA